MAQATRCPHCQTAFKVVRDQLLLREGWVRCGHCSEPFNALDHLIDLNPPAPQPTPSGPLPAEPEQTPGETPPPAPTVPVVAGQRWNSFQVDQPAYLGFPPVAAQGYDMTPAPQPEAVDERGGPRFEGESLPGLAAEGTQGAWSVVREPALGIAPDVASRDEGAVLPDVNPVDSPAVNREDAAAPYNTADDEETTPLSEFNLNEALNYRFDTDEGPAFSAASLAEANAVTQEPEFVRQAQRQARWNSTPARATLGVLSLVLLLVLAGQAAMQWRNVLAQQWPASQPWLQQLCNATTGCQLAAPRDLDALVIDSSTLSPAKTGLQVDVLLRNRIDRAVAWPALELTLTDAQGKIEQRKVLEPAQFLPAVQAAAPALRAGIAPGQQMQLQLHLAVSGTAPAGYKLLLFYP